MISKQTRIMLVGFAFILLAVSFTLAANNPTAPRSITEVTTHTFDESNYAPQSVEAIAGNITGLTIDAIGQTKSWQGYYGNISGTITLDDASNNTFYNWSTTEPRGEVYATLNSSVTWGSVSCFDLADVGGEDNETNMEVFYTIATDDVDGVAETYTATTHPDFQVASNTMTSCPTAYPFRDDAAQTADFANVLLYDSANVGSGWIYATVIENDTAGSSNDLSCFNGEPCDFQLFVNEDGHGTDVATTTYYFWVELS